MFSAGVQLMLISTLSFAFINLIIKELSYISVFQLVFLRSLLNSIYSYIYLKKNQISLRGNYQRNLILRGISGFLAFSLFVYTIQNMPLATAVTIQYLSPIFTTLIALFFLNEKFPYIRFLFYAIAFLGVFIIKGIDNSISLFLILVGIISSFFSGISYNLVRSLRNTDEPELVVFYFVFIAMLFSFPLALLEWKSLGIKELLLVIGMSILTQIAQTAMTKAYQSEALSKLSILNYLGILYAIFLGYLFYHEKIDFYQIVGTLCILSGVLANILIKND